MMLHCEGKKPYSTPAAASKAARLLRNTQPRLGRTRLGVVDGPARDAHAQRMDARDELGHDGTVFRRPPAV